MKKYNTWAELNVFLMFAGFPLLVTFFQNSAVSIAYRGFALIVALICCVTHANDNQRRPHSRLMLVFMGLYIILDICCLWDLFIGYYADTPYIASRNMAALFIVGVSFFPVLGVYYSYQRIRWERIFLLLFYAYLFIIALALSRGFVDEISGRGGISSHMGTLGLGETGVYQVIVSAVLLRTAKDYGRKKVMRILFVVGVVLGVLAIFRAASRGPFVGVIAALSYFFMSGGRWNKFLTIVVIVLMIIFSAFTETIFSNVAPVLYERIMYAVEDEDTGGRDVLYESAINTIKEHPLKGGVSIALEPNGISNCHNMYLDTTLELGLVGGFVFVTICIILLVWCLRVPQGFKNQPTTLFFASWFIFCLVRGMSGLGLSMGGNVVLAFVGLINCKEKYDYSKLDKK